MEVRREEILTATTDLLDRIGLSAIRVADVAKELGISPGLVFYHFGTKDTLVAEAFAHAVERDLHRLEKAAAGGAVEAQYPAQPRHRVVTGRATGWRIWIDAWAVALRDPHIRKVLKRLDQQWQDILRGVVDDGVATGVFTCPDPAATVARLSALVDGLSVAAVVHRTVTREQLRSWVAAQLAVELGVDVATLD